MDLDQNTIEAKLNEVTSKVLGCIAAGVVGTDGIPISEFKKLEDLDISVASAELASIIAESKRILKDLQSGIFCISDYERITTKLGACKA